MTLISEDRRETMDRIGQTTQAAARRLALLSGEDRNRALGTIAEALSSAQEAIVQANAADCEQAQREGISPALLARLRLGESKLQGAIAGIRDLQKLADPLGEVQLHRELAPGLVLKRIACPLGVLGIIFEARPEALIQITALAIKSGNGVILKGGREAIQSCQTLVQVIHRALARCDLPAEAVQLLTTREEIQGLLTLDAYVDLIIPRGSNAFVRYVQENTRIPVLGHADGICHLYVDQGAHLDRALRIAVDAKTQYPAACNAIETLLVHRQIAPQFLPHLAAALGAQGVELRGDEASRQWITAHPATEEDWRTEYSDLILAIRVVDDLEEAIAHIAQYGSRHTEAIVTEDQATAQTFMTRVDAAGVYHNCSTRFADGFRYGFGAEVGISTSKLPPRGPVGLEGLVTYKYQMTGQGQIVADFGGEGGQSFTHRDL